MANYIFSFVFIPFFLALVCALDSTIVSNGQPNIFHIIVDDLGWGELSYHNPEAGDDISSPNFDAIAATGLQLDRLYGDKICSPSRSSFMTGRLPIHVNEVNVVPEVQNPSDPVGGYQGIPINMTGIAELMSRSGYSTHLVGKWDVGMATELHSPWARGFKQWLGYWHHSNDYWTQNEEWCQNIPVKDLWRYNATFNGPAVDLVNADACTQSQQDPDLAGGACVYEEDILLNEVLNTLRSHANQQADNKELNPLFLVYTSHLVHMPLQAKQALVDDFDFIDNRWRQLMHAMVKQLDSNIGTIIQTLHDTGLWDNTLVVIHSDNGGEIMTPNCGGNNWPLRGGKFSNFEGGIRVNALVTGGVLPVERRGQVEEGLMSVADWYATYAHLAGLLEADIADGKAARASLPPVDSLNCWDMIAHGSDVGERESRSGGGGGCRSELPIGDNSAINFNADADALVGGLISGRYKLLIGPERKQYMVGQDVLTAPLWPNRTTTLLYDQELMKSASPQPSQLAFSSNTTVDTRSCSSSGSEGGSDVGGVANEPVVIPLLYPRLCGRTPEEGCLFDIFSDPQETHSLATELPEVFYSMLRRIDELQLTVYSPDRGDKQEAACEAAIARGYYWGPWVKK